MRLGLNRHGGKNSRQWKKIQAYFRMGFRADAEGHLFHITSEFFKVIEKAKAVLDDAFENGVPIVEQTVFKDKNGSKHVETQVHLVQGLLPRSWDHFSKPTPRSPPRQ